MTAYLAAALTTAALTADDANAQKMKYPIAEKMVAPSAPIVLKNVSAISQGPSIMNNAHTKNQTTTKPFNNFMIF